MGYVVVDSFALGVDRRRPIYAGTPGALWDGINCHLSRGGDVEKRKAFVLANALPSGTFGLAAWNDKLGVFGSSAVVTSPDIQFQQLAHPTGLDMTEVVDVDLFNGLPYVIAKYTDGSIYHFYNGTRVAYWDGITTRPTAILTHKNKLYAAGGSVVHFSDVADPTAWTVGTPSLAGSINMANQYSGAEALVGLAPYQQLLGIFAEENIQLWNMSADPADNAPSQVLNETGARSNKAILAYGDIDVFYLAKNGIRSIRSRDSINVASVSDVGTPIDTLVIEWVKAQTTQTVERSCAVVEPTDGRFWLAIGSRVFVFSYFPSSKIAAWTWYEPGFAITDFAKLNGIVYARSGDSIYAYGGSGGDTYDSAKVTLQLPFMSAKRPATHKTFTGIDIAAQGAWFVDLLPNPNELAEKIVIGELEGFTPQLPNTGAVGHATHVAPRLIHEDAGAAVLSQVIVHFQGSDDE